MRVKKYEEACRSRDSSSQEKERHRRRVTQLEAQLLIKGEEVLSTKEKAAAAERRVLGAEVEARKVSEELEVIRKEWEDNLRATTEHEVSDQKKVEKLQVGLTSAQAEAVAEYKKFEAFKDRVAEAVHESSGKLFSFTLAFLSARYPELEGELYGLSRDDVLPAKGRKSKKGKGKMPVGAGGEEDSQGRKHGQLKRRRRRTRRRTRLEEPGEARRPLKQLTPSRIPIGMMPRKKL